MGNSNFVNAITEIEYGIKGVRIMKELSLVAIVKAKPEQKAFVKEEIMKLIPITRNEKGCIHYHLYQDNKDDSRFILEENWASYEEWQAHMHNDHMENYSKVTKDAVESWELNELTKVD